MSKVTIGNGERIDSSASSGTIWPVCIDGVVVGEIESQKREGIHGGWVVDCYSVFLDEGLDYTAWVGGRAGHPTARAAFAAVKREVLARLAA